MSQMKVKEIQDLIDFLSKTGLNEVNIETDEFKIHIVREPKVKQVVDTMKNSSSASASSSVPAKAEANSDEQPKTSKASKLVEIRSPMIGTFYRSPNPDSPSFVEVGDKIGPGQTVCIIEAMKLFNEIEAEISGTIVKVLVENASPVEYDQPLFLVEPN
jgi:acetyl-CoA carboxylase biotin carboxyl carrier protein